MEVHRSHLLSMSALKQTNTATDNIIICVSLALQRYYIFQDHRYIKYAYLDIPNSKNVMLFPLYFCS